MLVFQHRVLGWVFFFCLIYDNFSCLCMLPLTCCPHLSQVLSLKGVPSLFWSHHYKLWIHFIHFKLKSIVLTASIFQAFSAQFSSVLPSLLCSFFLHSISVTGTAFPIVNQNLADYESPRILQAFIANLFIFLYLSTELMGSCFELCCLIFWAVPCVYNFFFLALLEVHEKNYLCRSLCQDYKAGLWALSWTWKFIIHSVKVLVWCFLVPNGYVLCCGKQTMQKERLVRMYLEGICLI